MQAAGRTNDGFSFWDALILEAALRGGTDRLISEDMQDGRAESVRYANRKFLSRERTGSPEAKSCATRGGSNERSSVPLDRLTDYSDPDPSKSYDPSRNVATHRDGSRNIMSLARKSACDYEVDLE